ncbi:MAG: hypothetical protein DRP23_06855, partial [Thermotogae bacterium]
MKIDLGDVLVTPFKILSEKWTILVPIFIALAIQLILDVSMRLTGRRLWGISFSTATFFVSIILEIITYFLLAWQTTLFKEYGEEDLSESFSKVSEKFIDVAIVAIVVGFLVGLGTLAYIIPGLILAIMLVYSPSAVVVKNMGASEAIKESFDFVFKRGNLVQTIVLLIFVYVVAFIPVVGPYISTFLMMLW